MAENRNQLNFKIEGTGRPVLFIHGFLESSSMWQGIDVPGVQKIMPDLPGHGLTQYFPYDDLNELAELISDYVEELQLNEYDVVGHSMGGYLGLELKATDPKCRKLILLNSNFWGDSLKKKRDRVRIAELVATRKDLFVIEAIPGLFHDPEKYDSEVKELIKNARKMSHKAIASASLAMMKRPDRSELVGNSGNDIYVIQGEKDLLTTTDQMSQHLPENFTNYFEVAASHMSWVETPEAVSKILENALID